MSPEKERTVAENCDHWRSSSKQGNRSAVLDEDNFWFNVWSTFHGLEPVSPSNFPSWVPSTVLSHVHEILVKESRNIEEVLPSSVLTTSQKEAIANILHERRNFICRLACAAANLLDPPSYRGPCLSNEDVCYALYYITEVPRRVCLDGRKVLPNLAEYPRRTVERSIGAFGQDEKTT